MSLLNSAAFAGVLLALLLLEHLRLFISGDGVPFHQLIYMCVTWYVPATAVFTFDVVRSECGIRAAINLRINCRNRILLSIKTIPNL